MTNHQIQKEDASNPKWLRRLSIPIDLLFFGSGIWILSKAENTGERWLGWFLTICFALQLLLYAYALLKRERTQPRD